MTSSWHCRFSSQSCFKGNLCLFLQSKHETKGVFSQRTALQREQLVGQFSEQWDFRCGGKGIKPRYLMQLVNTFNSTSVVDRTVGLVNMFRIMSPRWKNTEVEMVAAPSGGAAGPSCVFDGKQSYPEHAGLFHSCNS